MQWVFVDRSTRWRTLTAFRWNNDRVAIRIHSTYVAREPLMQFHLAFLCFSKRWSWLRQKHPPRWAAVHLHHDEYCHSINPNYRRTRHGMPAPLHSQIWRILALTRARCSSTATTRSSSATARLAASSFGPTVIRISSASSRPTSPRHSVYSSPTKDIFFVATN